MTKIIYSIVAGLLLTNTINAQIGIGTSSANSNLQVAGAVSMVVRSVNGDATADFNDQVIVFTGTTASTITLPAASACSGRVYWIKNASVLLPVPSVTVAASGSDVIDDVSNWNLDEPNEVIRIASDGTNWQVLSQNVAVRKTTTVGTPWLQGGNSLKSIKAIGSIENYGFNFITNNTVQMHLTNTGYLGLGTVSPQGRIHSVADNDDAANNYYINDHGTTITQGFFIRKSRGTIAIPSDLQNGDIISQFRFSGRYNGSLVRNDGSGMDAYYTGNGTSVSTDMRFFTSGQERMRVSQNGYIGINTSSFDATNPEKLLVDAGNTSSYNVISGKGNIDNYLQLNIKNSNAGTNASSDIVATADNGNESVNYIDLGINSSAYTNTTLPILTGVNTAYLYAVGNEMRIGNGSAYDLAFFTNGYTLASERMRITASGNVGVGTNAPADKLSVAGIFSPATDNTYTMGKTGARWSAVYAANGTIQTSDLRLKKNIQPLSYGLSTLMQMRPVQYAWKENQDRSIHIGLIAQEVRTLVPEIVSGDESREMLGMNYAELVPVLINTIQEQQVRLAALNKQLKKLKKQ